jgi:hypothetical protein
VVCHILFKKIITEDAGENCRMDNIKLHNFYSSSFIIKENDMGRVCSTHKGDDTYIKKFSGKT